LKRIEAVIELFYNNNLCKNVILFYTCKSDIFKGSPFIFYSEFSEFLYRRGFFEISHKTSELFNFINDFIIYKTMDADMSESYLAFDLYSFDKVYEYPIWLKTLPDKDGLKKLINMPEFLFSKLNEVECCSLDINELKKSYRNMELVHFTFNKDKKSILFIYGKLKKIIDLGDTILK
jgi:hypothetical protein